MIIAIVASQLIRIRYGFYLEMALHSSRRLQQYIFGPQCYGTFDSRRRRMRRILLMVTALFFISSATAKPPSMAPPDERADRIHVDKSERTLRLYRADKLIATYRVRLGRHPKGHKREEGDERTPEGMYRIDYKNDNSGFHLSLHISYPNEADREQAQERNVSPGGDIMIHGGNTPWKPFNWTDGCIAVSNKEIEQIWRLVDAGTPITIEP
jgi:murein L,D-transpeptidase YafK